MTEEIKKTRSTRYNKTTEKEIKNNNIKNEKNEKEKTSNNKLTKILFIILAIFILFFCYISLIEPSIINVKEYKVEATNLPNSFHGLKIVHFSDIHYGTKINKKQLDKIVTKINNINPDIIIFTGDLIDKNIKPNDEIKKEIKTSLSKLECTLNKYAIYGNEDNNYKDYEEILKSANFTLLNNETKLLYYKDNTPILIGGFNSENTNYSIIKENIEETSTSQLFKIILIHEPDNIDQLIEYNPNIVLSGHTLGGLIKLPFLKPLFLEEGATKYYEDYYKIKNTELFISNGLGTTDLNVRLNNYPSINLYRLYKKDSN